MGTIIPEGFAQVTVVMRGPGATKNSTWSMGAAPSSIGGMASLLETWDEALTLANRPCNTGSMVTGWQYLGLEATYMDASGPLMYALPNSVTGTKDGAAMPVNCAFLVTKSTASGGRQGRGRIFFPPSLLGESGIDAGGFLAPGIVPTLQEYFTGMLDDMQVGLVPPYLLHDGAAVPYEILSLNLQGQIATQRRRLR